MKELCDLSRNSFCWRKLYWHLYLQIYQSPQEQLRLLLMQNRKFTE
jgi:hypothetical protein